MSEWVWRTEVTLDKRKHVARSSICPSAPFCGWNVHLSPHFHSSSDPCPEHFCLLPPRPPLELSPASESLVANFFLFLSFLFFLFLLRPVWINKDHLSPLMWTLWLSCGWSWALVSKYIIPTHTEIVLNAFQTVVKRLSVEILAFGDPLVASRKTFWAGPQRNPSFLLILPQNQGHYEQLSQNWPSETQTEIWASSQAPGLAREGMGSKQVPWIEACVALSQDKLEAVLSQK